MRALAVLVACLVCTCTTSTPSRPRQSGKQPNAPDVCREGWTAARAPDGTVERSQLWKPDPAVASQLMAQVGATKVACWHRLPASGKLLMIDGVRCHEFQLAGASYRFIRTDLILAVP